MEILRESMFHRESIVSLNTGDRFIAKAYQSRQPLRDKYLYLLFSLDGLLSAGE